MATTTSSARDECSPSGQITRRFSTDLRQIFIQTFADWVRRNNYQQTSLPRGKTTRTTFLIKPTFNSGHFYWITGANGPSPERTMCRSPTHTITTITESNQPI